MQAHNERMDGADESRCARGTHEGALEAWNGFSVSAAVAIELAKFE